MSTKLRRTRQRPMRQDLTPASDGIDANSPVHRNDPLSRYLTQLGSAANAFHGNYEVDAVKCRETEMQSMKGFMENCMKQYSSGLLYISGAPGTGKTFCVERLLDDACRSRIFKKNSVLSLNAAGHTNLHQVLEKLGEGLGENKDKLKEYRKLCLTLQGTETILDRLLALRRNKKDVMAIVIDEVDQLRAEKRERVTRSGVRRGGDPLASDRDLQLVKLFSLALRKKSKIFMIVIANSVNLMNDIEHRMKFFDGPDPTRSTIFFEPYGVDQLRDIVANRLAVYAPTLPASALLDDKAVELCIRRVAASHGDCRMVLDACRRAVADRLVAASRRRPRPADDDNTPRGSPLKKLRGSPDPIGDASTNPCTPTATDSGLSTPTGHAIIPAGEETFKAVGMADLQGVMNLRLGALKNVKGATIGKMPVHQQLLLCSLLDLSGAAGDDGPPKVPASKLYDAYRKRCADKSIPAQFSNATVVEGLDNMENCGVVVVHRPERATAGRGRMRTPNRTPSRPGGGVVGVEVQLAMEAETLGGALSKSMGAVAASYFI